MDSFNLLQTAFDYFQNGNLSLALQYADQFIDIEPDNASSYTLRGIIKHRLGNTEEAIKDLVLCTQKFPDYVDAFAQLGMIYEQEDKFSKSYKYFRSASLIDSSNPKIFICLGNACCNLELYDEGRINFLKAAALTMFVNPNDPVIQEVQQSVLRVDKTIKSVSTQLALMDNNEKSICYLQIGINCSKIEEYEKAVMNFDLALSFVPTFTEAYYNRGRTYRILDKIDEAIKDFENVIKYGSDDDFTIADTLGNLADLHGRIKNVPNALYYFQKSLEIWPENIAAIAHRAQLLSQIGDFSNALRDIDKVVELMPNWGISYMQKGWILLKSKQFEEAKKALLKAIELEPTLGIHHNIGEAYYGLGDYNNALKYFIMAFVEKPDWSTPIIYIRRTAEALLHPLSPPLLESPHKRPIALVIGNSDYHPLDNLGGQPINDALDIYSILGKFGFIEVVIKTDLKKADFAKIIEEFQHKIKEHNADAAFLFYSGHGAEINNQNYLLPIDCPKNQEEAYGIKLGDLLDAMTEAGVLMRMAFLDACRTFDGDANNAAQTKGKATGVSTEGVRLKVNNPPNTHTFIAFATAFGQPAMLYTDKRNSDFTTALKNNLRKGEDVATLFQNVRREVRTLSNGLQIPEQQVSMDEVYVF